MKVIRLIGAIALAFDGIKCDTKTSYDYYLNGADWGGNFTDCGNGGH